MTNWMRKGLFLLLATVLLAGCPGQKSGENVLATFDGGSLTVEDVQAHMRKLTKNSRYKNNPEILTPQYAFDHAVNMEMIITKGLKEKLHLDPNIRAEIHGFMADLFLKVMQDRLVPQIDKNNFSEEEVRAYFDAHPESYSSPELYDVRVIKAADETTLKNAAEELAGGAMTFEDAAKLYSTDERTKEKGGFTGKRTLKRFRGDWRGVIANLEVGQISEPVALGGEWCLLKLAGKTESVPYEYEDKKAYVRNDLLYARYREAWQETYEQLRKEFFLKVEDPHLENFIKGEKPS